MNGRQNLFIMKRFSLFLALATLLFCACDSDTVKVRGEVEGLNGTVKSREEYGLILMERPRLRLFWIQKI